jgi:acetylornithine/N-succinyldiaminopimelate aminotransferase
MSRSVMPTYARMPVSFVYGQGAWLFTADQHRYLDAISGIAVCNLGHAHPKIARALADQASKLIHTSNLYGIELQEQLASALTRLSGMDNAFFCNSGAEANEAALKLARKMGHLRGIARPKVVVMDQSFHGRTLFTLSATGNPKVQEGFEPLVDTFIRVPFGDIDALSTLDDPEIVAVLLEPVQGEGGVRIPEIGYLSAVRELTRDRNWLMMLDEVQSGMGRTGRWFGFQHEEIRPDVMTLAKALGNGVPIGACLAAGEAAGVLTAGKHGSTFGGNPLACRAALTVIEIMEQEHLVDRAAELGQKMLHRFREGLAGNPRVTNIRGRGLMIGIELDTPCTDLTTQALAQGLLINVTAERTIRLLPPLILDDAEMNVLCDALIRLITEFTADFAPGRLL